MVHITKLLHGSFVITGCYKEDTATVKISLANLPVAQVQQKSVLDRIRSFFMKDAYAATPDLYIAALKGNKPLEVVILNRAEAGSDPVEMEVPAGDGITIVILYYTVASGYYYENTTVNLSAGKDANVSVNMTTLLEDMLLFHSVQGEYYTCNAIPGASKFIFKGSAAGGPPWEIFYKGKDTKWDAPQGSYKDIVLDVDFNYFNITFSTY